MNPPSKLSLRFVWLLDTSPKDPLPPFAAGSFRGAIRRSSRPTIRGRLGVCRKKSKQFSTAQTYLPRFSIHAWRSFSFLLWLPPKRPSLRRSNRSWFWPRGPSNISRIKMWRKFDDRVNLRATIRPSFVKEKVNQCWVGEIYRNDKAVPEILVNFFRNFCLLFVACR